MLQPLSTQKVRVIRDVVFNELASWYEQETISTPTPINLESAEQEIENGDRLKHMFEESPITTRLSGPQESLRDQITSRLSPKMDKGKAKMPKYEDDQFDGNKSTHSLDSEFGGLDVPLLRTPGVKKAIATTNEKLHRSTREKNPVSRFGYNDHMAYQYAFMMKVAVDREPGSLFEATKNPRWVEAMNEEMQALSKNKTWISSPTRLTRRQSATN